MPEFVVGLAAFRAVDESHGEILWGVPAPAAAAPLVADIDGDGLCEMILPCSDGKLRVYK